MCGIVGAVAQRDVAEILVEGLKRLEYRGYDSAGLAVTTPDGALHRLRRLGKVKALADSVADTAVEGGTGIAHTRWATHGEPSEANAHPHMSGEHIAVVHNGIIENHQLLREQLEQRGYQFTSDTDTEVICHLVDWELNQHGGDLLAAFQRTIGQLEGAYGTVVMDRRQPEHLVAARSGSPLVIGCGIGENFLASDQLALLNVTRRFIFLEEGDIARVSRRDIEIFDVEGNPVERNMQESSITQDAADKGQYRHYMQKEIFEQPAALTNTFESRLGSKSILGESFGQGAEEIFSKAQHIQIIACGTSYNAGLVARYWFESIAGISCDVEIASEFRYRNFVSAQIAYC